MATKKKTTKKTTRRAPPPPPPPAPPKLELHRNYKRELGTLCDVIYLGGEEFAVAGKTQVSPNTVKRLLGQPIEG